jgi:RNA polymerase sigma-70 factor (ECF subfamily)
LLQETGTVLIGAVTSSTGAAEDPQTAVAAIWKDQAGRLVGGLLRMTDDLDLAEDLAQHALGAALELWPDLGVPDNPDTWLMAVAKHRAVEHFRRTERTRRLQAEVRLKEEVRQGLADSEVVTMPDLDAAADHDPDDILRLILVCCHPMLSVEARAALTLRLLGGLTVREISRVFLVPELTIGQRIARAKQALAEAEVSFAVPEEDERHERVPPVLEVVYLIFTEGYAATAGEDWMRPDLCEEALRLGRLVAELFPDEPDVHGLLALMHFQVSRAHARTDESGAPVLLADQDRSRWDRLAIRRGQDALDICLKLSRPGKPGPYGLQAAIAAYHARAADFETTRWRQIAGVYDDLAQLTPTPVVLLNRVVAHGFAYGAGVGLDLIDEIAGLPVLQGHHLVPSVRADLLTRLDRLAEAQHEFERAASLAGNARERDLLLRRAAECAQAQPFSG